MPETIGNAGMTEEERLVLALHVVARADGGTPGQFLETLEYITRDKTWKKRNQTLREMLEAPPPHGAGIKADDALRLIGFTHPHEANNRDKHKALEDMRRVVRDELHEKIGKHGGDRTETRQGNNITLKQRGTSEDYTIRRLRRDRPDLADRVIAGELSANAAAIEAGFRVKRSAVALDPESIAALVIRNLTVEQIEELIERLVPYLPIEKA